MLSQEAIEKILGIKEQVDLDVNEMASKLVFTVFPYDKSKCSQETLNFLNLLTKAFSDLGVEVVPYEKALNRIPILKVFKRFVKIVLNNIIFSILEFFKIEHGYYNVHPGAISNLAKRNRIKKGINVIAVGENKVSKLPIDYTSSFTKNSIITILDCPKDVDEKTNFTKHFDVAMDAFSYHMTQIAIFVDSKKWIVYNFNASHPIYPIDSNFNSNVLKAIVPKIAAPIRPPLLKDFKIEINSFDVNDEPYRPLAKDFVDGGLLFDKTKLYPPGKKVSNLPFRSGFYRWIGQIHLDQRSGMSYGFLARQIPFQPERLIPYNEFIEKFSTIDSTKDYLIHSGHIYIVLEIPTGKFCLKVPPVWVLTQRSGSDKTKINPKEDLFLLGLVDGNMYLRTSKGAKLRKDYRPSFDTKVILAHAVGNAIIASIMAELPFIESRYKEYLNSLKLNGLAIAHWHGYIQRALIPEGFYVHGYQNLHVACSTAQSAIYALDGKLNVFEESLKNGQIYKGDIHIEPHHGTNITFSTIMDLANFLLKTENASELGNKYLADY